MKFDINKYINYSILGFALSLSISKAGTVFFSILMILLWLFEGKFRKKLNSLKESKFILFMLLLLLLSTISVIWSPDKVYAIDFMRKYWHFLVIPIIFTSLKNEYINMSITYFLVGIFISVVFSYGIFFELIEYKNFTSSNPMPFMDRMNYSTYLAFASLILFNKFFFEEEVKYKILYALYFLLTTSSLFLNGGRTGQVIFVFTIFLVGFLNIRRKLLAFILMLVLSSSILSVAYTISPNFHDRINIGIMDIKNIANGDFTESFGQRVSLWIIGANIFADNTLIGTGIGNELDGFKYYANKYDFVIYNKEGYNTVGFVDFHSSFIQYSVQLGCLGLILYIGIFYTLLMLKFKNKMYQNLNIIFVVTFILHSTVFFSFHLIHPMVLFALFASVLSVISRIEREESIK